MSFEVTIKKENDYLCIKLVGEFNAKEMRSYDPKMLAKACDHYKCDKLLIDIQKLTGEIGTLEKFEMGLGMATYLGSQIKVVVLGTEDQISDNFTQIVAVNRGANVDVFSDKREAVQRLHEEY